MRTRFAAYVAVLFLIAGVVCAQDKAGSDIINATSPSEGVLFGGQPTAEQLLDLARADYKTIIDLRGVEEDRGFEESLAARAAGLEYVTVPMSRDTMGKSETWSEFVRLFSEAEKPVLVHCRSGGRVGAAYYAYLVAEEGMSREDAKKKASAYGMPDRLATPVDAYLDAKGK